MLKKSVIIAGRHYTSISMEAAFFEELQNICRERSLSLNALITEIDSCRQEDNLSAAVRVYILQYIKSKLSPEATPAPLTAAKP